MNKKKFSKKCEGFFKKCSLKKWFFEKKVEKVKEFQEYIEKVIKKWNIF